MLAEEIYVSQGLPRLIYWLFLRSIANPQTVEKLIKNALASLGQCISLVDANNRRYEQLSKSQLTRQCGQITNSSNLDHHKSNKLQLAEIILTSYNLGTCDLNS
jgi:hypothetical protein